MDEAGGALHRVANTLARHASSSSAAGCSAAATAPAAAGEAEAGGLGLAHASAHRVLRLVRPITRTVVLLHGHS